MGPPADAKAKTRPFTAKPSGKGPGRPSTAPAAQLPADNGAAAAQPAGAKVNCF